MLSLLGICKKSDNIVFGKESIRKAIYRKQNGILVIMANDIGKSLSNYLLGLCKRENIDIIKLKNTNKKDLGKSIGKSEISAVAVTDRILANKILKKLKPGGVISVQDSRL
ncbi:MAG: ribosomal L7Ae/L30e/S12e/Gadd45 family protein [Kosmotogaceae bacterium]